MALSGQHKAGLKTYEELRNNTSPLDELFGRALPNACDLSPCGTRASCEIIQPDGAYACCGRAGVGRACSAYCPSGYVDCTVQAAQEVGLCCKQAASSALAFVKSTTTTARQVSTTSEAILSSLPIADKSTTKVQAVSASIIDSSIIIAGGPSSTVQTSLAEDTTLMTTPSSPLSSVQPATVTIHTTTPNGLVSSFPSISTPTPPRSSQTGVPAEGLSNKGAGGLSSEEKIAISVAIPIAFILAIIAFLFLWRRRRKNKKPVGGDEGTGIPELDSSSGPPGYSTSPKPDLVKPNIHELSPQSNTKEEYMTPSRNGASEMEAAMAITALRSQQLARNRSAAGMASSSGPPTFEMPVEEARLPVGSELAPNQDPNAYAQNGGHQAVRSPTGYATVGQPSEMPYSPVYEADAYSAGYSNHNQNEMPGSPVSPRSERMAGGSVPEFSTVPSSPRVKRKDLNTGPLVVPDELKG